jgi:hypothetical protein
MNPSWLLLVPRLVEVGLLPDDPEATEQILEMGPSSGGFPQAVEAPATDAGEPPDPVRR